MTCRAIALAAAMALAAAVPATADGDQSAVGAGGGFFQENGGPFHLMLSAHRADGDALGHARGTGDYLFGEFRVEGEVTCLRVVGNRASIKYRIRHAEGPGAPPQGGGVQVYVEDNGEPAGGEPVDRVATDAPEPPGAFELMSDVCLDPALRPDPFWTPLDSGNYTVRGA